MEASKKSTVWIWASVAAAATGIAAVGVVMRLRDKGNDKSANAVDHRDLQRILSDCYHKIEEIELRLPKDLPTPMTESPRIEKIKRASNAKPLFETS